MDVRQVDAAATSQWFAFDRARLQQLALSLRDEYRQADPFPHVVIDGLLPDSVLEDVVREFPEPTDEWRHFDDSHQRKYGAGLVEVDLGPVTRNVLAEFNSSAFVDFVRSLTGIEESLIPDPYYRGGGLHEIEPGGHLDVHADFNKHPDFGLDRRVNVLVYLNHHWRPEWGGQLELWDPAMTPRGATRRTGVQPDGGLDHHRHGIPWASSTLALPTRLPAALSRVLLLLERAARR